jgi:hypothetical protein
MPAGSVDGAGALRPGFAFLWLAPLPPLRRPLLLRHPGRSRSEAEAQTRDPCLGGCRMAGHGERREPPGISSAVPPAGDGEAWIPDTSSFAALGRRSGMTKVSSRGRGGGSCHLLEGCSQLTVPHPEMRAKRASKDARPCRRAGLMAQGRCVHASPFCGWPRFPHCGAPFSFVIPGEAGAKRRRRPGIHASADVEWRDTEKGGGVRGLRRRSACRRWRGMDPGYVVLRCARTSFQDDECDRSRTWRRGLSPRKDAATSTALILRCERSEPRRTHDHADGQG